MRGEPSCVSGRINASPRTKWVPSGMDRYWLITWPCYGTWLPGAQQGFVSPVRGQNGDLVLHNIPGTPFDADLPALEAHTKAKMKDPRWPSGRLRGSARPRGPAPVSFPDADQTNSQGAMANWAPSILMFLLAGAALWRGLHQVAHCREAMRLGQASLQWPTAVGQITASSVECLSTVGDEGAASYAPDVGYSYSVGTTTRTGKTIAFRGLEGSKKSAEAIVAKYPVGTEVTVHYEPTDNGASVLEPGTAGVSRDFRLAALMIFLGIAIAILGIVIPLFHLVPGS